ncbi:MAG: BrnT family toxin [Pseudomonadota bacterium]
MEIEFDPAKSRLNLAKHGVDLGRAVELDIRGVFADRRRDYGEPRFLAFGLIDGVPHCLAFTVRGDKVRAISLRRAHRKEFERYVETE